MTEGVSEYLKHIIHKKVDYSDEHYIEQIRIFTSLSQAEQISVLRLIDHDIVNSREHAHNPAIIETRPITESEKITDTEEGRALYIWLFKLISIVITLSLGIIIVAATVTDVNKGDESSMKSIWTIFKIILGID